MDGGAFPWPGMLALLVGQRSFLDDSFVRVHGSGHVSLLSTCKGCVVKPRLSLSRDANTQHIELLQCWGIACELATVEVVNCFCLLGCC